MPQDNSDALMRPPDPFGSGGLLSPRSQTCSRVLTAKDYFADCPWLNIPKERRAEILIEPLYPRRGLLGGSSKESRKTSKLAALAAARKQKASEQSSIGTKASSSSASLLDKLGKVKSSDPRDSTAGAEASKSQPSPTLQRLRKYPARRQDSKEVDSPRSKEPAPESPDTPLPVEPMQNEDPIAMYSAPSAFAEAMMGEGRSMPSSEALSISYNPFHLECNMSECSTDPFAGPSPDDVVAKAQSASKGMKSKGQSKDSTSNDVNGVTKDLNNASIADPKPPKSKNLNVLEEYNKSKRKNAANFVVIGKQPQHTLWSFKYS